MGISSYLFSFKGRIGRAKMWLFLPIALLFVVLSTKFFVFGVDAASLFEIARRQGGRASIFDLVRDMKGAIAMAIYFAFLMGLVYVWLAVLVKRLHDRNKGASWLIIYWICPMLLGAAGMFFLLSPNALSSATTMVARALIGAGFVLAAWAFVELFGLHGTIGDNRFGADPVGSGR